eukprot:gene14223-20194_t
MHPDDIHETAFKTRDEHLEHIELVLKKLAAANLHVKISKCTFDQPNAISLGFQVPSIGLSVGPKKIAAVADWSLPHDLLYKILAWPALDVLHVLKEALIQAPLLVIPFTRTTAIFELYTNASGVGVGAMLLQNQGNGP